MKTRVQKQQPAAPEPKKPVLVSVPKPAEGKAKVAKIEKPDNRSKRGGFRAGAGRPAYLKPEKRKGASAYISMTQAEKEKLEAQALKANLTLSYYLREKLGLSND